MNKVFISALGALTKNIPHKMEVEISQEISAFEFVATHFNIPPSEPRMAFIINGRMQKGNYIVQPGDVIKVLKMGGAG